MKALFTFIAASLAFCFLTLVSPPISAQEKSVRPGINKPFENPDLKDFLKKFEGESREIATSAKEIVSACKLKPGMIVADVGAGTGLFTRRFATEIGEKGKVFAVDIAPTFLRYIEKTCEDGKIKNVKTILCDQFSTKLPKNSVDFVFICDTYHHFEFPQRTLQSLGVRPGRRHEDADGISRLGPDSVRSPFPEKGGIRGHSGEVRPRSCECLEMAFSFSIRVVDSVGAARKSVRVVVMDPRPIGLGGITEYTQADGWANFEWPDASSAGLDVYVEGKKQGYHVVHNGKMLCFVL